MRDNLEYYLEDYATKFLNTFKNKKVAGFLYDIIFFPKQLEKLNYIYKDYTFLTNFNKSIEINDTNQYSVLKVQIDTSMSLHKMAKNVLKNILKGKHVLVNNKPVEFKDCVFLDIVNTSTINFNGFHTDVEYFTFTGNAFNVWYLIENYENYGNMFILESSDYKKKYTPCRIDYHKYNVKDKIIPLKEVSYLNEITNRSKSIGYLNKENVKISYTNLKNNECIVMSKHLLHGGDHRRKNNVKGFHFRVLVKNEDGSINYDTHYTKSNKFPNHRWDEENKKLYGVELLDFI